MAMAWTGAQVVLAGPGGRKYVDDRMDAAPVWDGEMPETKYREHARNLHL